MTKEEIVTVLEYLPNGYPLEKKNMPIAQAIGEENFTLLELVPRRGVSLEIGEEVYIGEGKRDKIYYILGRLDKEKITEAAKDQLAEIVERIVKKNEEKFVRFFNEALPINKRIHQIELLPGLGKKHMKEILKQREQKQTKQRNENRVVRILSKDIEGNMGLYAGLTKIKGISWTLSNAICQILKLDKNKKIGALTNEEIDKITNFFKSPELPKYLLNRQNDFETGENKHLIGNDLELTTEFDIKRLKKIKSYRGSRHLSGLPMRGQRTKSNFRRNRRKGAGIKKKIVQ